MTGGALEVPADAGRSPLSAVAVCLALAAAIVVADVAFLAFEVPIGVAALQPAPSLRPVAP